MKAVVRKKGGEGGPRVGGSKSHVCVNCKKRTGKTLTLGGRPSPTVGERDDHRRVGAIGASRGEVKTQPTKPRKVIKKAVDGGKAKGAIACGSAVGKHGCRTMDVQLKQSFNESSLMSERKKGGVEKGGK